MCLNKFLSSQKRLVISRNNYESLSSLTKKFEIKKGTGYQSRVVRRTTHQFDVLSRSVRTRIVMKNDFNAFSRMSLKISGKQMTMYLSELSCFISLRTASMFSGNIFYKIEFVILVFFTGLRMVLRRRIQILSSLMHFGI